MIEVPHLTGNKERYLGMQLRGQLNISKTLLETRCCWGCLPMFYIKAERSNKKKYHVEYLPNLQEGPNQLWIWCRQLFTISIKFLLTQLLKTNIWVFYLFFLCNRVWALSFSTGKAVVCISYCLQYLLSLTCLASIMMSSFINWV